MVEPVEEAKSSAFTDALRTWLRSNLNTWLSPEESMRIPKDVVAYLLQQVDRTRRDMFGMFTKEVHSFFKNADIPRELKRALHGMTLQVRADIRFVDTGKTRSKFKTRLRHRRSVTQTDSQPAAAPAAEPTDTSAFGEKTDDLPS